MPSKFVRCSGPLLALLVGVALAGVAGAIDEPDAPGPWKVGHSEYFVTAPPPAHLPGGTPQFYDLWYPVDNGDWVGSFTEYKVFTIPPSTTFKIISAAAREDVDMSSTGDRGLIVFSHGSGSVAYQSISLCETLASHGFIVIAPTHDGNNFFDNDTPIAEVARQRPKDVSAAIDHMLARNVDNLDDFFGAIDASKIGVTGHSFGGFSALAVASGYDDGVEDIPRDTRVEAVYPVSPAHGFLSDAELKSITVPTCYMDGSLEPSSTTSERPYGLTTLLTRMDCRSVVIGATHTHFANICDIGQALKDGDLCPVGSPPCGADPTDPDDYDNWNVLAPGNALSGPYVATCVPPALDIAEVTRLQNLYAVAFFRKELLGESEDYGSFFTDDFADTEPLISFFLWSYQMLPSLGVVGIAALAGLLSGAGVWSLRRRRGA